MTIHPYLFSNVLPATVEDYIWQNITSSISTFAYRSDFLSQMRLTFGTKFAESSALKLAAAWKSGNLTGFPDIQILTGSELQTANGAYSATTGKIYLSQSFLSQNQSQPQKIVDVILEEYGHYVDTVLNTVDSLGDEGAIFSALVQGKSLDNPTLQALQAENDHATITVNGQNIPVELSAPGTAWTKLLGTSSYDQANALTTGSDGAIYLSGNTDGNLDGQTNSGGYDAFITKYNADGSKAWTKLLGTSNYENATDLTTGSNGAIYLSGYTEGNLDGQTNNGGRDAFITKYNADGSKAWTKLLGTSGEDGADAVTTGSDGAIYVSGYTQGNLDGLTNSSIWDAFITKYNTDGSKAWTQLLGSSNYDFAYALTTGSDGAIYVSGITSGNLDGQTNSGSWDAFITKYNSDGSKAWTKLLGTSSYEIATDLTTGSDGAIYVSGYTGGNLDGQTNSGGRDAFITKYNTDGSKAWTRLLGTSGEDQAHALTTGSDGAIYVSGPTQGNLDGQTNSGGYDTFITKYNTDGSKAWTKLLGTSNYDGANALTTGSDGAIYVSGSTEGNLDGQTNSGGSDAFITKLVENQAPTNLTLSNSTVAENQVIATVVGNLSSTDPDAGNTFTYSLVTGTGATDNSLFSITNNQLTTNSVFDFETKNSYSVRVRTTDQGGLSFEKQLTIGVTDVNETSTNLTLSNSTVTENQVIGTVVGNLSSTDPDTGNTFTYSLVTGTGATDNSVFTISANQLKTNSVFDYETKNSYSVRVKTTDQGGLSYEKQLTIGVNDLNEITGNPLINNGRTPIVGTAASDYITGGPGAKTITGGAGNDFFVFTDLRDVGQRITDFTVGTDKIVLTQLIGSISYSGANPIADQYMRFVAGTGSNTGSTFLQIDRDGILGSAIFKNFLQVDNITATQLNNVNNFVF
jgi:uncharacterized delta-60 repeat protein